jgi:hypothetical protein
MLAFIMMVADKVLVCENGMTVEQGVFALKRKHTTGLGDDDLAGLIDGGICNYLEKAATVGASIEELQALDFENEYHVNDLLVIAGREGVMPWSGLGKVERLWREPDHPEFEDPTGWSLYNCFTQVARDYSPRHEMTVIEKARELVLNYHERN